MKEVLCGHSSHHAKGLCYKCYMSVYQQEHRKQHYARVKRYRERYPEKAKTTKSVSAAKNSQNNKIKILTHYSKNHILGCSWPECQIEDLDMLTLDHIDDSGAKHRAKIKRGGGNRSYVWLILHGLPEGYQTLCWNHQWKKEIQRRENKRQTRIKIMAEGIVRTNLNTTGTSYKNGFPVAAPLNFGQGITLPHQFGATIPPSSTSYDSNPVTWSPTGAHFGNVNP